MTKLLLLCGGIVAQAGMFSARATLLDTTFDAGGGTNVLITAMARQSDGRIVIAEAFFVSDSAPRSHRIARLNTDGSADPGFNPGAGPDGDVNAVAIQPDGRIVIAGFFNRFNGVDRSGVARLNADGSLDASFDPGTGVDKAYLNPQVHTVALHADGRVVIGGYFTNVNGVARHGIAQLSANGAVDLSFDPGTGLQNYVALTVAALENGRVLVGGIFDRVNGVLRKSIARLNADGSLDESFSVPNGGIGGSDALERVYALGVQPDGRVIIGGDFTRVGNTRRQHVARLNTDGSLDESFDPGFVYLQRVSALALQADGRIVLGGDFRSIDGVSRNCVARLMSDGSLDLGFDPGTGAEVPPFSSSDAFVHTLALQPDGRILVAGLFDSFDGVPRKNIARLHAGSDTHLVIVNFAPFPINRAVQEDAGAAMVAVNRIGAHDRVVTVDYATHDGTAQAGTDYTAQSGTIRFEIGERTKTISIPILEDTPPENSEGFEVVLTNPSADTVIGSLGTLDVTIEEDDSGVEFSAVTYSVNELDSSVKITVQRVGKIGFGGRGESMFTVDFATADGSATAGQDYLAQSGTMRFGYFLNDWERQKTFNIPILDDTLVEGNETILLSLSNPSDGVILGERSTATVIIADNDTAPVPGRGANDAVQAILPLSDGNAIISGDFTFVDGIARNRIARLSADISLDTSFDPGSGADATVYALALQPDGKVLLGGAFTNVNGVLRRGIARLNADGSVDPAFDPGLGVQSSSHGARPTVKSIAIQTNGQILIGGYFAQCAGLARDGIARLNADGSVDTTFNPSYGQDAVFPMALQPDGKILAGGYLKVSGFVIAFARLNVDGSVDDNFQLGRGELGAAHITAMALHTDGRILMNGRFIFNGTNEGFSGVLRFNNDGAVDRTYVSTNFIAGHLNGFVLQPDEKLIVGGRAANISGVDPDGLVRLNPDGSMDAAFDPKIDAQKDVLAVAMQPGGVILIGGTFRTVNGMSHYRIARLNADGSVAGNIELNPPRVMAKGEVHLTTMNSVRTGQVIEASTNLRDWVPIFTNATPGNLLDFIDADAGKYQRRFYRAVTP